MFHIGDPKEFWDINRIPKRMYDFGWYYGEKLPSYESFYEETEKLKYISPPGVISIFTLGCLSKKTFSRFKSSDKK